MGLDTLVWKLGRVRHVAQSRPCSERQQVSLHGQLGETNFHKHLFCSLLLKQGSTPRNRGGLICHRNTPKYTEFFREFPFGSVANKLFGRTPRFNVVLLETENKANIAPNVCYVKRVIS